MRKAVVSLSSIYTFTHSHVLLGVQVPCNRLCMGAKGASNKHLREKGESFTEEGMSDPDMKGCMEDG